MGPALVSPAILGAADDLQLKTLVNGEVRQQTNTSDLYLGVRNLIAFCRQDLLTRHMKLHVDRVKNSEAANGWP
ncbi:hypothetical protein CEP53_015314 [Fusarium sp. AF-6]|nr:hypothetical protein CEP53_015314 [Fusarium sp. AF-6]